MTSKIQLHQNIMTMVVSKTLTAVLVISAIALGFTSCKKVKGEGPVVTQTRTTQGFSGIDLRMAGDVYYKKDSVYKLELVAQQNILDIIETQVENNRLVIKFQNGKNYHTSDDIRINVSGPDMSSLVLNTAGSIHVLSSISPSSLFLRTDGSGNISLQNVAAHAIEAISTGSGDISATGGSATTETLITEGSGRIDLSNILGRSASARTIGSGSIKLNATDNLHATITGSGSIYFRGWPAISSHIQGSGHLQHF